MAAEKVYGERKKKKLMCPPIKTKHAFNSWSAGETSLQGLKENLTGDALSI